MSAQHSVFETQLFEKSIEESWSKRWTPAPLTPDKHQAQGTATRFPGFAVPHVV